LYSRGKVVSKVVYEDLVVPKVEVEVEVKVEVKV